MSEREKEGKKRVEGRRSAGIALYVSGGITAVDAETPPKRQCSGDPSMAIMQSR